jgi:radical SAM superfamily enzyme YgiQ (UPF0313 family)
MNLALVKVSSINDRLIPLGLACLQAYLKQHKIPVDVYNFRPETYLLPKVFADPLIQEIPPNFIMNHQDFPILLSLIENVRQNKEVGLDLPIFSDLFKDYANRVREKYIATKNRLLKMINYSKTCVLPSLLNYTTIGFSVDYQNIADTAIASLLLKLHDPLIQIIWGGATITQSSEAFKLLLQENLVDSLIIGEGEYPMRQIANNKDFRDIRGVMSLGTNNQIRYQRGVQLDINTLPSPDYSNILLDTYFKVASVYRSRGCTNRCQFCAEWNLFGPKFRVRSVKNTIQDIETVLELTNPTYMIFGESLVNDDHDYFTKLCNAMIEKQFPVSFGTHFRAQFTPQIANRMAKAGFNDAWVGFEAFTDDELTKMNKGASMNQNLATIKYLTDAGVNVLAMLVVGFSTMEDELKNNATTIRLIEKLSQERSNGEPLSIQFRPSPMFIVPGSFDYKEKILSHTKSWICLTSNPENSEEINKLQKRLTDIPYEFRRPILEKDVGILLQKIREADRKAGFKVGGLAQHCINFMVEQRKTQRKNKKLEKFGIITQRAKA